MKITERAVMSVFQPLVENGMETASSQVKTIRRRTSQIARVEGVKPPLLKCLHRST